MKILLLSSERGWGGGEEQLRLLADGLAERGHNVTIGCRSGSQILRRSLEAGRSAFALPGHPRGLLAIWHTRKYLAREQPDVIHANDAHAATLMHWATLGNRRVARIASRRVVFPIRSPQRYVRGADLVLCVSRAIAAVAEASGIPTGHLRVVYDGIDLARMASGDAARGRASLGLDDDVPLLLVVASLVECKGHRYLIEALPAVLREVPKLQVVFSGEGQQRVALTALLAEQKLSEVVQLVGFRSDVPDLMQASDLFVLPSLDEGLGTSAIDALVAGKPVVATTAGGLPEVLGNSASDTKHGWLVPPRDPMALAKAIVEALTDPIAASRLTAAGQQYAHQHFSADAMVEATLTEYARVVANKPASA